MKWTDTEIDRYVAAWGEDPTNRHLVDVASLTGEEAVLDVGCGSGTALRYAAQQGHRGRLFGVDPYARMVFHAKRLSTGFDIEFRQAAAEALPFDQASFDVLLAINAIHHWEDQSIGLAETARVLRDGGVFVVGGERFDAEMLPEGQDYRALCAAHGFALVAEKSLDSGAAFAQVYHLGDRHV